MTLRSHGLEKLALVIPTLREAANLPGLLANIQEVLAPLDQAYELMVVDDNSGDGTEEIVTAMAARDARVRLLVRRHEKGLAGAVVRGWRNTDAEILGVIDGDGQHPPEVLPALLAAMHAGRDAAVASRFMPGSRRENAPVRGLISAVALSLTRPLLPMAVRIRDPLSGFFLVRRACIGEASFQGAGFKLLLEILAHGQVRSVEEIPFEFGRRQAGRSKAGVRVGWDYLRLAARLYARRWARQGEISAADRHPVTGAATE